MTKEELNNYIALEDCALVEAMKKIDINAKGVLFVVNENRELIGVVTDGDVRRWIIRTGKLDSQIHQLMNQLPKYVYEDARQQSNSLFGKYKITAIPVITKSGQLEDVIFPDHKDEVDKKNEHTLNDVPVVIMAGGKGTRLYPYTKILPKPLIPIGDIPIMERIINRFQEFGTQEFWITVNYRKNMIMSYFADLQEQYFLHYVEENQPLGTAGSLHLLQEKFHQPFIVTNCDILIQADYADIYRYHCESGNALTIVTALKNMVVPYGVIHPLENGGISSMEEKPKLSYFVNTGFYVLNEDLLEKVPQDMFFHMTDLADLLLKEGVQIGMYPISEESFLDMGEFEEMHKMERKLELKTE